MAYDLQDFQSLLPAEPKAVPQQPAAKTNRKAFLPCFQKVFNEGVPEGARNQTLFRAAIMLIRDGYDSLSFPLLCKANAKCSPPITKEELKRIFENASKENKGQPRYKSFGCEDVMAPLCSPDCPIKAKQSSSNETASMANALQPQELTGFLNEQLPQVENYWGDGLLQPESRLFVGGGSKVGKSMLMLNLCLALSNGLPCLDFPAPKPLKVLLLQAEISRFNLQKRLKTMMEAIKVPKEGQLYLLTVRDFKVDRPEDHDRLCSLIEEIKPNVVVLDPLSCFHSKDENSAKEVQSLLDVFDRLIDRFNVSLLISHHHKKPSQFDKEGGSQLRGSSKLFDYGDAYLTLNPHTDDGDLLSLTFTLRNAESPATHTIMLTDRLWFKVVAIKGVSKASKADILATLTELGGSASHKDLIAAIAERFEISPKTAARRLTDLEKEGVMHSSGKHGNRSWTAKNLVQGLGQDNGTMSRAGVCPETTREKEPFGQGDLWCENQGEKA